MLTSVNLKRPRDSRAKASKFNGTSTSCSFCSKLIYYSTKKIVPKQNLTYAIHKILVIIFGVEDSAVNVLNGGEISGHVDSLMRPRSFRRAAAGRITGKGQIFGHQKLFFRFHFSIFSSYEWQTKHIVQSVKKFTEEKRLVTRDLPKLRRFPKLDAEVNESLLKKFVALEGGLTLPGCTPQLATFDTNALFLYLLL